MSSLAAVQADGFYYPPDFDPIKHGSLNNVRYHGTHALRERAARLHEGILVIRFEVPFHIWCSKCGEKIAKGERFNVDKKAIGMYHSTKILQFSMRHHCGCIITIQTDPKNTEYIVVEGAKRKVEGLQSAAEAEVMELPDDEEKARRAADPLYRLEQGEASRKRARTAAEEVADLLEDSHAKHHDEYRTNATLRAKLRVVRKEAQALDKERRALNLPDHITLLPAVEEDATAATLAFFAHERSGAKASEEQAQRRQSILSQPIFLPAAAAATAAAGLQRGGKQLGSHRAPLGPGPSSRQPPQPQEPATVSSRERSDEETARGARAAGHTPGPPPSKRPRLGAGPPASAPRSDGKQLPWTPRLSSEEGGGGLEESAGVDGTWARQGLALVPAAQPGAASGQPVDSTAAAVAKRRVGLASAHAAARGSVAAWRAGRDKRAAAAAAAAATNGGTPAAASGQQVGGGLAAVVANGGGGSSGFGRGASKVSAAVKGKAALVAQRNRMQGIGLKLPDRHDGLPRFR